MLTLGKKIVKWYLIPQCLPWTEDADGTAFALSHAPIVAPEVSGSKTLYKDVYNFLARLKAKHTTHDTPGITWVELTALFVARGGSVDLRKAEATAATSRTTLPQAVAAFKSTVRLIIRDTDNLTLRKYFGPSIGASRRLDPLGYDNHIPTITCIPVATPGEAKDITKFLLSLRCNMKQATTDRLEAGTLWLPKTKLVVKGVPNWKRFLGAKTTPQPDHATTVGAQPQPQDDAPQEPLPTHIVITCPSCQHSKRTHPSRLIDAARWKYTWCAGPCQKAITASRWLCACNKPWHSCVVHATCQPKPAKRLKITSNASGPNQGVSPPLICPNTSHNRYTNPKRPAPRPHIAPAVPPPPPPSLDQSPNPDNSFNLEARPSTFDQSSPRLVKETTDVGDTVKEKPLPKPRTQRSNLRSRFAFGKVTEETARAATEKDRKVKAEAALDPQRKEPKLPLPKQAEAASNATEEDSRVETSGSGPSPAAASSPEASSPSLPHPARPGPPGSFSPEGPLALPLVPRPPHTSVIHCGRAPLQDLTPSATCPAKGSTGGSAEPPSTGTKRKLQDIEQRKRQRILPSPTAAYPAIFARSQVHARRFSSLVGGLPH